MNNHITVLLLRIKHFLWDVFFCAVFNLRILQCGRQRGKIATGDGWWYSVIEMSIANRSTHTLVILLTMSNHITSYYNKHIMPYYFVCFLYKNNKYKQARLSWDSSKLSNHKNKQWNIIIITSAQKKNYKDDLTDWLTVYYSGEREREERERETDDGTWKEMLLWVRIWTNNKYLQFH